MLTQQTQEMWRNVPDPLFMGGSRFCGGSGVGDETIEGQAKSKSVYCPVTGEG